MGKNIFLQGVYLLQDLLFGQYWYKMLLLKNCASSINGLFGIYGIRKSVFRCPLANRYCEAVLLSAGLFCIYKAVIGALDHISGIVEYSDYKCLT